MTSSEYVNEWREKNYERSRFQARVDNTKYRIRNELKKANSDMNKVRKMFILLDYHEEILELWKAEHLTYARYNRLMKNRKK